MRLSLLLFLLIGVLPAAAQVTPPEPTPAEPVPAEQQEPIPQPEPEPEPQQTLPDPEPAAPTPQPAAPALQATPAPQQVAPTPQQVAPVDTAAVNAARRDSLAQAQALEARLAALPTPTDALPPLGPVWTPPADLDSARASLERIRAQGFTVARTTPRVSPELRAWAARLGVALYADLPLAYLTSRQLADTLGYVARLADSLSAMGDAPALAGIGLGSRFATGSNRTCDALEEAAAAVRAQASGTVVYYETDPALPVCPPASGLPLLDLRNADDAHARWQAWSAAHPDRDAAVLLGRAVRRGQSGLRADFSPERAARTLETTLTALAADTTQPAFVFVHRWSGKDYGLIDAQGADLPALVVAGYAARGVPGAPALAAGEARPARTLDWLRLSAWGVVLLMGLALTSMLRMRQLTERFFTASGFFREDVRGSRDGLRLQTIVFATLVLAAGAVAVTQLLLLLNASPAAGYVRHLVGGALPFARAATAWMLPLLLVAAGWLVLLVIGLAFALLSRGRHSFTLAQALMIQAWPRWTFVVLLVAALVAPGLAGPYAALVAAGLLIVWGVLALAATAHAAYTFAAISNTRLPVALLVLLLHPLTWLLLAGVAAGFALDEEFGLLLGLLAA